MNATSPAPDASIARALKHIESILIPGERIEAYAVQHRLFALLQRRVVAAATSGRFIILSRGWFGGFSVIDVRWQDLRDAKISVGMIGATITIVSSPPNDLASRGPGPQLASSAGGLSKEGAQRIYRLAQEHEQAWREKRRVRDLEEMRARSGALQMPAVLNAAPHMVAPPTAPASSGDAASRLQQAKQMLDARLISDSEFEAIKARIISNI